MTKTCDSTSERGFECTEFGPHDEHYNHNLDINWEDD